MGDERAEPFIDRLVVRNYGCVKDVSVALTPFHAFIGPNDSGKSTLLRAMHRVVHAVEKLDPGRRERMDGFNDLVSMKSDSVIEIRSQTAQLAIDYNASTQGHVLTASSGSHVPNLVVSGAGQSTSEGTYAFDFRRWIGRGSRLLRLDPDKIGEPTQPHHESG